MVTFTAVIMKFDEQGEKTGWTYIVIPPDQAEQLSRKKTSFRVKGKLDSYVIEGVALLPVGSGQFILPLNATMRKNIRKKKGAMLKVSLALDTNPLPPPPGFMESLADEPAAAAFFAEMKLSHRNYFIKWLGGVKTDEARAKRIAQAVTALSRRMDFVEMVRSLKKDRSG